jgi:hypothetical protein
MDGFTDTNIGSAVHREYVVNCRAFEILAMTGQWC